MTLLTKLYLLLVLIKIYLRLVVYRTRFLLHFLWWKARYRLSKFLDPELRTELNEQARRRAFFRERTLPRGMPTIDDYIRFSEGKKPLREMLPPLPNFKR